MTETFEAGVETRVGPDPLATLDTPVLLLDGEKLERNCRRMRERLAPHGVTLRPHVKTAKCVDVAATGRSSRVARRSASSPAAPILRH